jgi:hypothetical protein
MIECCLDVMYLLLELMYGVTRESLSAVNRGELRR